MATKIIRTVMEIEDNGIVTIRGRHAEVLAKFRCDPASFGTFERVEAGYDCDNYWIAVKPSDDTVFNGGLFDPRNSITVTAFEFVLGRRDTLRRTPQP